MILNAQLLELQCKLLVKEVFSEAEFQTMMAHPAMTAFLEHEQMLRRGTTEGTIRCACKAAIAGSGEESSLRLWKARDIAKQLLHTANVIQRERQYCEQ